MGGFTCTLTRHFSPVLVALRAQPPLTPYRRRITIPRQSGGGLAPSPVMSPWTRRSLSNPGRWFSPANSIGGRIGSPAWKVGMRSGSACLSAGQPVYRAVRE